MKKLYTLLLAAAVTLTAAAANPLMMGKYQLKEDAFAPKVAKKATVVSEEKTSIKTLSNTKVATPAPDNLETVDDMYLNYTVDLGDGATSVASEVTFTKVEEEEGLTLYTMTGWLVGLFQETITIHPMPVVYENATGKLSIPCQTTAPILTFNNNDYSLWSERKEDGYLYDGTLQFEWNGDGFTWIKEYEVTFEENGEPEIFTVNDVFVGRVTEANSISTVMSLNNLSFKKPAGTWSTIAHIANEELTETTPQDFSTTVFTTINGSEMIMDGFFQYDNILFTIDYAAKTLTAENQKAGQLNIGTSDRPNMVDTYLSEAINTEDLIYADNAYPFGVYKLEMTYEVADGKTNITCPNWNIFAPLTDGKDNYDINALVPFTDTKITLNYELTATSGIDNVTVADENAPVEYYNLQGVRVANPESGLYIKRQGNKAIKVLVK